MKRIQNIIAVLAVILSCGFSASAQIYVTVRPSRPIYVRPAAPGPGYIWIDEDWNGVGDRYEWRGGYWAAPPTPGYYYRPGYWRHSSHGYVWKSGSWGASKHRHGRSHGHGHHKHKK